MGPTNNLGYLIQHLAAVMGKQSEHVLKEQLGIGISQYRILMVLDWNPRVQQSAIATSLGQTEAARHADYRSRHLCYSAQFGA
jgi:DNA-binding MarR family transcriptional regulator